MDLEDFFTQQGWRVVATAPTVESAIDAIEKHDPEVAVLDLNLHGRPSLPVAETLQRRAIPFVIVSGYGSLASSEPTLDLVPVIEKPWNQELLLQAVSAVVLRAHRSC
jgi:DNA-binding response OmpR family regulator